MSLSSSQNRILPTAFYQQLIKQTLPTRWTDMISAAWMAHDGTDRYTNLSATDAVSIKIRSQNLTICCYFRLQQEREGSCYNFSIGIISALNSFDRISLFTVASAADICRNTVKEMCLLRWKLLKNSDNLQKCKQKISCWQHRYAQQ